MKDPSNLGAQVPKYLYQNINLRRLVGESNITIDGKGFKTNSTNKILIVVLLHSKNSSYRGVFLCSSLATRQDFREDGSEGMCTVLLAWLDYDKNQSYHSLCSLPLSSIWGLPAILGVLGLQLCPSNLFHHHLAFLPFVSVFFSSYKDTRHWIQGPPKANVVSSQSLINYIGKDPVYK